jgi:hypothetical protein
VVTALIIIFLILAIIFGVISTFPPYGRWVGLAVAFIAVALLVPHLGIH